MLIAALITYEENFCFLFLTGSCVYGLKLMVSVPGGSVTIFLFMMCNTKYTVIHYNLKYKLLRILRNSTNEEPGVVWIKQTREKRTIVKENSNHDNDNDDKADIIRQMFRVLLREIEDFKL